MVTQELPEGIVKESRAGAIVYCEGHFGGMDGRTANGLVRQSNQYRILAVIDSTKVNRDVQAVISAYPDLQKTRKAVATVPVAARPPMASVLRQPAS